MENDIDYKAWAAEYKKQEDYLKSRIDKMKADLKKVVKISKEKGCITTERGYSLNKQIDFFDTLYREAKTIRIVLEERYEAINKRKG